MAAGRPSPAAVGAVGEELLFACVAAEAEGPLVGLRGSLALQRSLRRCFLALTLADVSPAGLGRVAERLRSQRDGAAERIAELARLYQRYRSLLAAGQAKLDSGLAWVRQVQTLAKTRGPLPALSALGLVATPSETSLSLAGLHRLPSWDGLPSGHAVLQALATLFPEGGADAASLQLPQLSEGETGEAAALEQALKPTLEALYARHALALDIEWQPLGPALSGAAADTPWGRFLRGLFRPANAAAWVQADELSDTKLTVAGLPTPAAEARFSAQRIRDLIAAGTAAADIGIVVEDSARRARVARALRRYGVPVRLPVESRSFADCGRAELPPPLSLPLQIYELLQQGLPREGLLSVITSPYVRLPLSADAADASALSRALRGAGVRALAGSPQDELRRRISEWLRLQNSKRSRSQPRLPPTLGTAGELIPAWPAEPDEVAEPVEPVELRQLAVLLSELHSLPREGTLRLHTQALARLCERLQLPRRAQGFIEPSDGEIALSAGENSSFGEADERAACEVAALARDQAAVAVLRRLLHELPLRADALRLGELRFSRERFATLWRALCQRLWADVGRQAQPEDGAVQLAGLFDLPVQPRSHLFCLGLIEGELPAGGSEDPLLSDDDRKLCNRLFGAQVFPLAGQRSESAPLRFVELLAHSQAAHLTYPRADEEGRPLLSSSFLSAALHAAGRDSLAGIDSHATTATTRVPDPASARHPSELWLAAAPAFGRSDGGRGLLRAVATELGRQERDRRSRLLSRLAVERARSAWFATLSAAGEVDSVVFAQAAGPHSGQLSESRLIAELASRLPGGAQRPLSASALEDYARCPFRFFVYRVLHAAPIEEGGDDLDPLTSGRLHHRVLEKFFAELRDSGRLPLVGDEAERALLLRVIDEVLIEFDERERTGHPTLFRARLRRLRSDLLQLIAREARSPLAAGCLPTLLEHPFGPLRIAAQNDSSQHQQSGEAHSGEPDDDSEASLQNNALHIAGIIDRIDIGPGRALVLDYKTGQIKRYQDYLRTQLLRTSFQLPLYAAAVQADPQVAALAGLGGAANAAAMGTANDQSAAAATSQLQVSARYYAVRQAAVSQPLADAGLFALGGPLRVQAGEHNVAEVAYRLWRRLRAGDFRVAPKTCEGCGLESVCRIGTASVERLVDGADASESETSSGRSGAARSSPQSTGWASAQTPAVGSADADGEAS